ncbi:MAG: hypothetical protein HT580_04515 [Dechloromonas sp.]|nr:MAG: hypothetical protein HT580_04515 [Dechloromonas sp.]
MARLFHLTTAAGRRLWRLGVRLAWIAGLVGLAIVSGLRSTPSPCCRRCTRGTWSA